MALVQSETLDLTRPVIQQGLARLVQVLEALDEPCTLALSYALQDRPITCCSHPDCSNPHTAWTQGPDGDCPALSVESPLGGGNYTWIRDGALWVQGLRVLTQEEYSLGLSLLDTPKARPMLLLSPAPQTLPSPLQALGLVLVAVTVSKGIWTWP